MAVVVDHQQALDLFNKGVYEEAEPILMEIAKKTKEQQDAGAFMWERRFMECVVAQERYVEAEPLARRAVKHWEHKYGPDDEDTLDCQFLLAECLWGIKDKNKAFELIQEVCPGMERNTKRGPEHPTTLSCKALYALILQACGKVGQANEVAEEVSATLEAVEQRMAALHSQGSRRLSAPAITKFCKTRRFLSMLSQRSRSKSSRTTSKEPVN